MQTAKIFNNGRSQAVRLPMEFRFNDDEVLIKKVGNITMLIPKDKLWETFLEGVGSASDDFFPNGREDLPQQEREWI